MHAQSDRGASRARTIGILVLSLALAYGSGLWLFLIHQAEGAIANDAAPALVQWLRDSTLMLPLVLLAVWLGVRVTSRVLRPFGEASALLRAGTAIAIVALLTSVGEALASPLRDAAFGGQHIHQGVALPLPVHMAYVGFLALAANLLLATLVLGLLRGRFWTSEPRVRLQSLIEAPVLRRGFAVAVTALMAATAVGSGQSAALAAGSGTGIGPCPASAPIKTFDVSAIDMKMWLNRFGDNDPQAQMYVLDSMISGRAGPGERRDRPRCPSASPTIRCSRWRSAPTRATASSSTSRTARRDRRPGRRPTPTACTSTASRST